MSEKTIPIGHNFQNTFGTYNIIKIILWLLLPLLLWLVLLRRGINFRGKSKIEGFLGFSHRGNLSLNFRYRFLHRGYMFRLGSIFPQLFRQHVF